jgi:WD40 repeat protein
VGELAGHTDEVNSLDFHPTQHVVATSSDDSTAIVWDATQCQPLRVLDQHTQAVYGVKFLGKQYEFLMLTVSFDRKVRLFDMRDKSVVRTVEGHTDDVIGVDYCEKRDWIATGSDDGHIAMFDVRTWQKALDLDTNQVSRALERNAVKRIKFSPSGNFIAAGCSRNCAAVFDIDNIRDNSQHHILMGHTECVFDVAWGNSNPGFLVTASHDHTWKYWCEDS